MIRLNDKIKKTASKMGYQKEKYRYKFFKKYRYEYQVIYYNPQGKMRYLAFQTEKEAKRVAKNMVIDQERNVTIKKKKYGTGAAYRIPL